MPALANRRTASGFTACASGCALANRRRVTASAHCHPPHNNEPAQNGKGIACSPPAVALPLRDDRAEKKPDSNPNIPRQRPAAHRPPFRILPKISENPDRSRPPCRRAAAGALHASEGLPYFIGFLLLPPFTIFYKNFVLLLLVVARLLLDYC